MMDLRDLPPLRADQGWAKRREEIRAQLAEEMYGVIPEESCSAACTLIQRKDETGLYEEYRICVTGEGGEHAFPVRLWLPEKGGGKHPLILYLWNRNGADGAVPRPGDRAMPPADILKRGYALALCLADEIEKDDAASFPQGLARAACGERRRSSAGALAAWAYGLRLAAKFLAEREDIDERRIAAAGFSRFGKAALWSGAGDEIFSAVASFDSGCGGAAVNRGKQGEHITDMLHNFPHWLCLGMNEYAGREEEIPFDQHFLLALIAPRKLLVTSSTKDRWSGPYAEFLGLRYAQEAYQACKKRGIETWIWPPAGEILMGEDCAYYLREGEHGAEEEDWNAFLELLKA